MGYLRAATKRSRVCDAVGTVKDTGDSLPLPMPNLTLILQVGE